MATRAEPMVPVLLPPVLPPETAQYVVVNGKRTRFYQRGRGSDLLFIPSSFLQAASYRGTIEALSAHFQVTVAEMPGSGGSQRVEHPWGFAEGAEWAVELVDELGLDRPLVVGHSDTGGTVALLGAQFPDNLNGIVLVDSIGARPGAGWPTLMLGRFRDGLTEESQLNLPLLPHIFKNLWQHTRNCFYHAFTLAVSTEPLKVAAEIAVPTLIAWGRRDHTFPPECAERFHSAIARSRIAWSPACHDWLITHPCEFADAVARFAHDLAPGRRLTG